VNPLTPLSLSEGEGVGARVGLKIGDLVGRKVGSARREEEVKAIAAGSGSNIVKLPDLGRQSFDAPTTLLLSSLLLLF
jgi:hypothetical protein